jgi:hypothetical protein
MVWRSPNPNHKHMALYFGDENGHHNLFVYAIPKASLVQIFFVKARLPEEVPMVNLSGSSLNLDRAVLIYEIVNEIQGSGQYSISIDKTTFEKLGFGFYQLYFKADSWSAIYDCVIFQNKDDIPADLYELLMKLYRQE